MTAATAKRSTPEKSANQSRKAKDAAALRKMTQIKPCAPKAAASCRATTEAPPQSVDDQTHE